MMGGVTVDLEGRTTLPGLWAAGEVSLDRPARREPPRLQQPAGGDGLRRACRRRRVAGGTGAKGRFLRLAHGNPRTDSAGEPFNLDDIRNALKSLMWRNVGVRRDGEGLAEARETVAQWCRYALPRQFPDPGGWELQNMLCIARLMIDAALAREESRGAHVRTDFPAMDEEHWKRHISFRNV